MTKLIYLTNSYQKSIQTHVTSIKKKGDHYEVTLLETVFYPEGGGQSSDNGEIIGANGTLTVTHVHMRTLEAVHEGFLKGTLKKGEKVTAAIDWDTRFSHMRAHSAGHILHEVIMETVPGLLPKKGEHKKICYIEYEGFINPHLCETLEKKTNMLVACAKSLTTRLVSFDELKSQVKHIPEHLPKNKPLRILQIAGYPPIPDGGTQVNTTDQAGPIKITKIEQLGERVRVYYRILPKNQLEENSYQGVSNIPLSSGFNLAEFKKAILGQQKELLEQVSMTSSDQLEKLKVSYFGTHGRATLLIHRLKELPVANRKQAGQLVNEFKQTAQEAFSQNTTDNTDKEWFDTSLPGKYPEVGHLHIVTQAITEITRIFERIGFTRVRHPEVDWDWYVFESLNMPAAHPARDEWETFFIDYDSGNQKNDSRTINSHSGGRRLTRLAVAPAKRVESHRDPISVSRRIQDDKKRTIVLTPHTSNGQVREMEKKVLPIRMINIAKCYRRQSDVSHIPMFHQFEGLYIDKNVSIGHLKGVFDFFVKQFYGSERVTRLRPSHFQFTEPSFEVDISCGVCLGQAKLPNGQPCKLCKSGWLELGGAGMVHPVVLKNGGIDTNAYNGFAFGWGVERTYMMKSGTQLDDVRLLYSNDIRFLEQF